MNIDISLVLLFVIYSTIQAYIAWTNVCAAIVILIQGVIWFALKVSLNFLVLVQPSNYVILYNLSPSYADIIPEILSVSSISYSPIILLNSMVNTLYSQGLIYSILWIVFDSRLLLMSSNAILQPPRESGGTEATIGVS